MKKKNIYELIQDGSIGSSLLWSSQKVRDEIDLVSSDLSTDLTTHINDTSVHHTIQDSLVGTDKIWSSSKIRAEIDLVSLGYSGKEDVKVVTHGLGNITLSGLQTIHGYTLVAGDRIGVTAQTNPINNGIYIAASGSWTRASDFDDSPSTEVKSGVFFFVSDSDDTYAKKRFVVLGNGDLAIGTDAINFTYQNAIEFGTTAGTATEGNDVRVTTAILDDDFSANGIMVRTSAGSYTSRSILGGTGIDIQFGNGSSGNPTISMDINALTVKASPVAGADYVPIYDAAGATIKKALISTLYQNLSTNDLIQVGNGRTYTLPAGASATQFLRFNNDGGNPFIIMDGLNRVAILSDTFSNSDLTIGKSGTGKSISHYLPTGNAGYTQYSATGVLMLQVSSNFRRYSFVTPNGSTGLEININNDAYPFMRVQNGGWQFIYKPSSGAYEAMNLSMAGAAPYLDMRDASIISTVHFDGAGNNWLYRSLTIGQNSAGTAQFNVKGQGNTGATNAVSFTNSDNTSIVIFKNDLTTQFNGLVTLSADPTSALHAATKQYVDNSINGLKFKVDVVAASTANVSISSAPSTLDGVSLVAGDRILLKNQTTASENGCYIFTSAGSALTRSTDADTGAELVSATFPVRGGTTNQDTWFTVTNDTITLGTTSITFTQTGSNGTYNAGSGITLTGNTFSITTAGVTNAMLAGSIAASKLIGTDITTVGTIATGTWQATIVSPTYGGTGVNNGSKTITLGGNFTTSGAYNLTFTLTGTTTLTLPVTGTLATLAGTETFDNKRVNPRVSSTASSATPTPNADTDDLYILTALAAGATFGAPTGTPVQGQSLSIRIKDNGTARSLAFNAIYRAVGITLPTTTVINKTMYLGCRYNATDSKWDVVAYSPEA